MRRAIRERNSNFGLNYFIVCLGYKGQIMNDSFWIGVWPGLGEDHLDYMVATLDDTARMLAKAVVGLAGRQMVHSPF